jgi:SecD/SecF fusion protein
MQLKGIVRFVTIALIVLCLFQLSFTWMAKRVENKAIELAEKAVFNGKATSKELLTEEQKSKLTLLKNRYLDSVGNQTAYNLGFAKYTYQDCKEQELAMGLDLQGGMSVVLQVSEEDVVNAMSNYSQDAGFKTAMNNAKLAQSNSQSNFVTLFGNEYSKTSPNGKLASIFSNASNSAKISFNSNNNDVLKYIDEEVRGAVKRTHNIISSRIDKFGVTQPNVSLEERTGRILVELPGVDNPERVRKLLQATAQLEFWETYTNNEIIGAIDNANKALGKKMAILKGEDTSTTKLSGLKATVDSSKSTNLTAIDEKITSKIDSAKLKEEEAKNLQKENPIFAIMYPTYNPQNDPKSGEYSMIGRILGKDTSLLNSYLAMAEVKSALPKNLALLYSAKSIDEKNPVFAIYAIKKRMNNANAPLDGSSVTSARSNANQNGSGGFEVEMAMNSEGAAAWKRITGSNIGKSVAVVLDNAVYSAPTVQSEISGGRSSITGNFSAKESQDLANILQTGKLPAPAKIIQEEVVGASLGERAIKSGLMSFIIAFTVIFLLMYFYYNKGGMIANIALILNLFFTVGILIGFGFSLTMSAIAGFIVTIGMAVDTNVIIFERIKEELLKGKNRLKVVEDGYKASLAPIIDAHVTTFLTALILLYFGIGPVKGFATTLFVGLLVNLFCGILITRWLTDWWMSKGKEISYTTGLSNNLFKRFNFKFVENRKIAFIISGALTLLSIGSIAIKGFDYGVDFLGGRNYTIKFEKAMNTSEVRESLKSSFDNEYPTVKTIGENNQLRITTAYLIKESGQEIDGKVEEKLFEGLKKYYSPSLTNDEFKTKYLLSSQKVGPNIADDIKKNSIYATIFSLIVIFIYIVIRFKKWQYGLGTIIALFHDVIMVCGLFSLFQGILPFSLEVDQTFIAAILTIIGYSMNDTVIVFDRIREYVDEKKGQDLKVTINDAINHTMSRTIMTSLTVFLVVLILFILGGEATRGFAFAMLVGVITGTYSSIFIAMPVLYDLRDKNEEDIAASIANLKK